MGADCKSVAKATQVRILYLPPQLRGALALHAVRADRDFVTDCHKSRLTMRRCRRTLVRLS